MAPFEAPSECSSGCSKSGRDGLRQDTEENVPSPGCGSRTDRRLLQDSESSGSSLRARSNKEMALWEQERFRGRWHSTRGFENGIQKPARGSDGIVVETI